MKSAYGWVEIGDERYENDVIVHVDGAVSKRKKKRSKEFKAEYGHTPLSERELDFLEKEDPKIVFIGTGQDGSLPLTPGAKKVLESFKVKMDRTPSILRAMAQEKRPYVAIIHVTC